MAQHVGIAWTEYRRIVELGDDIDANAVNASGVIVGTRNDRAVRIELGPVDP